MGIQSLGIVTGATSIAATGGSAETFTPDGQKVDNGIHLIDAAIADFRVRPHVTLKYRPPVLQSTGDYSKAKNEVSFVVPKLLASGKTVFNVVRISVECHPESTAAEQKDLRYRGALFMVDTDTDAFWASGSLA